MDNSFFCIIRKGNSVPLYYKGYYERIGDSTILSPAKSRNLSEALKLTFKEEAENICKALGIGWVVKPLSV